MKRTASGTSSGEGAIRCRPRMGGLGAAAASGRTANSTRPGSFMPKKISRGCCVRVHLTSLRPEVQSQAYGGDRKTRAELPDDVSRMASVGSDAVEERLDEQIVARMQQDAGPE